MISKDLRKFFGKKLKLKPINSVKSNQKSKNYSAKLKLEDSLSGTSQISKIGYFVSILECIKQRYIFFTHRVNVICRNICIFFYETKVSEMKPFSPYILGWSSNLSSN